MRRFKSARHAQRFVEVHGIIASHFRPDATCSPPPITADFVVKDFKSGKRLRGPTPSRKRRGAFPRPSRSLTARLASLTGQRDTADTRTRAVAHRNVCSSLHVSGW
jgi:hypothetical protein